MAERPRDTDALVGLLQSYFFSRTDRVAVLAPWNKPHPTEPIGELTALLAAHVGKGTAKVRFKTRRGESVASGRFRVGSYVPAADGTTPWLCLDFDGGKDHADALVDPLAAATAALTRARDLELPAYLERSGGGAGWHVWVFFETGVDAAAARQLGDCLAPKDAMCTSGRLADVKAARGIEIFPKQIRPRKDGVGNMVWLPFWSGAAPGGNRFYQLNGADLVEYVPESFVRVSAESLQRALPAVTEAPASTQSAKKRPESKAPESAKDAWKAWRTRALAVLPLEAVYGEWLTGGRSGEHWFECRDPDSASGDQNPSAGVADGTGEAERASFHSFRTHETVSVFDFLVKRGIAADFRAAVERVAQLAAVPAPAPQPTPAPPPQAPAKPAKKTPPPRPPDDRPEIRTNGRQLYDVIQDAWRAVHKSNRPPAVFRRGIAMVRLREGDLGLFIEEMGEAAVFGLLARIALWVRVTDEAIVDVDPVKNVARDMLVNVSDALPQLEAVVTTPVFGRDRRAITAPGYHAGARLFYQPAAGLDSLRVAERPTSGDVAAARALLLDELLVDFPFVAESDRAHAIAALILPFVRRMISGATPLHLIEAPTPGTGKSLLAEVVAAVAAGHGAQPMTLGREEEENRKRITAALSRAQPVMLIDNVRVGLDSSVLAQVLTSTHFTDRILGQSRMIDLPNQALWIATANNPRLSLEIARRSIRIRLDPKCDRPWEGRSFRHERLLTWSREKRPELVSAVLTLVASWLAAGAPRSARDLGSFESWSETVGGILAHAGINGFLENLEELYELADAEGQEWRAFVAAWAERFGGQSVSAGVLVEFAIERGLLASVIGEKSPRSQATRLGKALLANRDRQFGAWRIECKRETHSKQQLWQLIGVSGETPRPTEITSDNPFTD